MGEKEKEKPDSADRLRTASLAGAIIGIVMFRMQAGASAYNESIKTAKKRDSESENWRVSYEMRSKTDRKKKKDISDCRCG